MEGKSDQPATVDGYIDQFEGEVRELLSRVREVIKAAAPGAEERIGYRMPGFYLNGPLVYFAAFKRHIGFYPTGSGVEAFKDHLWAYKWSRGAIQFPIDKPIPYDLITRIVEYRVAENLKKGKHKGEKLDRPAA